MNSVRRISRQHRPIRIAVVFALSTMLAGLHPDASAQRYDHTIPLVTAASNSALASFVRIINRSSHDGAVDILGYDDVGQRFGPVSLSLSAEQTKHLNSTDLENGNPSKGLSAGLGNGTGNWRLKLTTNLYIETLIYIRTGAGFVTSIHEVAPETREGSRYYYYVPFFNPGSNTNQVSRLRLVNSHGGDADVEITGIDDQGEGSPGGSVSLALTRNTALMLNAEQLENGDLDQGLSGSLGDGVGKWQLRVSADRPIQVMSLLFSRLTGNLANLSRGTAVAPRPLPPNATDLKISTFWVSPTTPVNPWQSMQYHVVVENRGLIESAPPLVHLYRSSDPSISPYDSLYNIVQLLVPVGPLSSREATIDTRAPLIPGTHYFGVCVVTGPGEYDTGNDCSESVKVTVQEVWGAMAGNFPNRYCDGGATWVATTDRSSKSVLEHEVFMNCSRGGGYTSCSGFAFRKCGALAVAYRGPFSCGLVPGEGESSSAAERDALSTCRNSTSATSCFIARSAVPGSSTPAVVCNSGYR